MCAAVPSCHQIDEWDNDAAGNFDALWSVVDTHYCFFREKDIDWDEIGRSYRARITPEMKEDEFFELCSDMLDELKDGHVNLNSWMGVSYYRKWWTDYPQNFNLRLVQEHYLDFDYTSGGGIIYKILEDSNVGYVRYSSFALGAGDSFVDRMLYSMKDCDGLIIDIRDNGGGELTNADDFAAHFTDRKILAGYICHKTGPGHGDFSEPYPYYIDPRDAHVRWLKPVIVLTNRSTFSAANNFTALMKSLPHVRICGDTTGGGAGMPFTSEIPCGWSVRMSASPLYDPEGRLCENGIEPSEGMKVDMDPEAVLSGHDTILDFAIEALRKRD